MSRVLAAVILIGLAMPAWADEVAKDPPHLFSDDFKNGSDRWEPTDADAWKVVQTKRGKVYSQFRQSKYSPPYRSPLNFSLVKDLNVADFVLEAQVQSTVKDYPHRDVCLFFGHQDAAHFYYVHLGKKTDDHANQIFIVNGAPRKKISTKTTEGTNWDDDWHHVKVIRHVGAGKIEVYFDDMKTPVMTANDKTFAWGRVGIGSFDDTADWADVKIYGTKTENWPSWRGPRGDGTSAEKDLPTTWSPTENVRWKVKLPGPGNSSPIVWGNRIFLTQSLDKKGTERAVLCFDRAGGKLLWQKSILFKGEEPTHDTNPYCAATPVTDGERVIASHGSAGVACYDFEGKQLWYRDLGPFIHIWGTAASPILYDDLVILNCGPGERTYLLAMDGKTGKDVWKVEEPGGKSGQKGDSDWIGSWSTPRIVQVHGQDQLIMSWPHAVKAYQPRTGELLWTCSGLTRLVYTSPLVTPEVVVAMSGFHGSALAVKTGGKGDVTQTHRLWHHTDKNPQRIGSGLIVGDCVYMVNAEPGTVQCLELKTGKDRWKGKRLGSAFWGSLVLADGKFYATDQEGDTYVFAAKPEFEQLSRNSLGEHTNASLAISAGDIFIRTYEHLWCIRSAKK